MKILLLAAVLLLSACAPTWDLNERAKDCYRQGSVGLLVNVSSIVVTGRDGEDLVVWSMTTSCGPVRNPGLGT